VLELFGMSEIYGYSTEYMCPVHWCIGKCVWKLWVLCSDIKGKIEGPGSPVHVHVHGHCGSDPISRQLAHNWSYFVGKLPFLFLSFGQWCTELYCSVTVITWQ